MEHRKLSRILVILCIVPLLAVQTVAQAGVIGAEQYLSATDRQTTLDSVHAALARADVQQALKMHGVEPAVAAERVAALNDSELVLLAENLEELPAGGLLATLGVVAIVLLILELVGVIDIFNKV
ncbi:MAG TPA: PA2779 family protein [Gammaproteobacteria bacterium]|nr:PA2779 family protein [Gammaproteobacteria bacterium]